jgi:GTP-binding protein
MVPGDPVDNFKKISKELKLYSKELTKKYMAVAATKIDAAIQENLEKLEKHCRKAGIELFGISSVTGEGLDQLIKFLADKVEEGKAGKEGETKRRGEAVKG